MPVPDPDEHAPEWPEELSWEQWHERWESLPSIDIGISAAEVVAEVRRERDEELARRTSLGSILRTQLGCRHGGTRPDDTAG